MGKKVKRLFAQYEPKHYILDLALNRDKMTFSGSVIITGRKTGRPSQRLTLHQNGLKITSAKITKNDKKGDQNIAVERINNQNTYEEARLHTTSMLYPGLYTIVLQFEGKITTQMNGIYPCFFKYKGQDKKLIATQFESHHAREVFPCIDEPEAKATFDLTLTVPKGEEVIANTPVKSQQASKGMSTYSFETTPKMSTYLLAFVCGDLKYLEAKTKDGIHVRTYATPDNVKLTKYALDIAVKCLEFFNDYFGIPYPLEKCDLIALPDFASGAMENWGCITFREHALLVDEKNTSLPTRQYVAMVVAHELAHQWFGNLVTMRWWTDLWLNEGFATWIEYMAVDELFPDWQMWTQFIADEQQQALKLDALEFTHPIEAPINHPDEIRSIFDAISYSKGASVIHMLHEYLGKDVFREGLRYYLKKHEYANTDTQDLWAAFEEVSEKPVKAFMHAWTTQAGFPLVEANLEENDLKLKQSRFFINPGSKAAKQETTSWPVPLLTSQKLTETLTKHTETFKAVEFSDFKLNAGQSGFYRVVYNATHLQQLSSLVKRGHLSPTDRLGLVNDMFEAAKSGHLETTDALALLEAFGEETNASVWEAISSQLASLRATMDDEDLREAMKPYVRKLVTKQLKRLGWQPKKAEPYFDTLLRPTILGMAAVADEPSVVKEALRLFATIKHPDDISASLRESEDETKVRRGMELNPDLRGVVYGTAVRLGGKKEFDKLLAMHNSSSLSEERVTISAALTGFRQPELIKRALELIDSKEVRHQDVGYWIAYSFINRHAKRATWDWLITHWDWLDKNLGNDLSFFRMPVYVSRSFSDLAFLKDYKAFFSKVLSPALDRSYNQGIETIEWQSAWKTRDLKTIKHFFKNQ